LIELIFTDPPYAAEYVPLYSDLAVIAHNVLKEGGSLVTYVGHYTIPKVIKIMENAGLTYWWPIAVILSGSFAKHYPRQVTIKWKPLLVFVKGDKLSTTVFQIYDDLSLMYVIIHLLPYSLLFRRNMKH
jgi:hypothetical protein